MSWFSIFGFGFAAIRQLETGTPGSNHSVVYLIFNELNATTAHSRPRRLATSAPKA